VKTTEPKTPLNVYIPVSLKQGITAAAEARGQTITVWVSRALNAVLRRGEAEQQ
jgi:hypothetical protein